MTNPDDELVEAMIVAANDILNDDDADHVGAMRAALAVASPAIRNAALADADRAHADLVAAAKVVAEALDASNRMLSQAFNRIHGLPRITDSELADALGRRRAGNADALALLTTALGGKP